MNFFEMMKNIKSLQGDLTKIEATGYSGADMVKVTLNGKFEIQELLISPEALKTDDGKVISELIKAAFHDAVQKVQQEIQGKMGGAGMGGILDNMLGGDK